MAHRSRLFAFLGSIAVLAIVGGIVFAGLWKLNIPADAPATDAPVPATAPAKIVAGRDYYVLVKLVEFNPRKPNGSPWDRGSGSAPDPKVVLSWRGSWIFELPTRDDQYIATWDLFRVNIADVVRSGGNVDIASSINAPLVQADPAAPVTIEVFDSDLVYDDLALKLKVPLTELHPGENDLAIPKGSGLKRLVVQLIDRETPLDQLITLAQKR